MAGLPVRRPAGLRRLRPASLRAPPEHRHGPLRLYCSPPAPYCCRPPPLSFPSREGCFQGRNRRRHPPLRGFSPRGGRRPPHEASHRGSEADPQLSGASRLAAASGRPPPPKSPLDGRGTPGLARREAADPRRKGPAGPGEASEPRRASRLARRTPQRAGRYPPCRGERLPSGGGHLPSLPRTLASLPRTLAPLGERSLFTLRRVLLREGSAATKRRNGPHETKYPAPRRSKPSARSATDPHSTRPSPMRSQVPNSRS